MEEPCRFPFAGRANKHSPFFLLIVGEFTDALNTMKLCYTEAHNIKFASAKVSIAHSEILLSILPRTTTSAANYSHQEEAIN